MASGRLCQGVIPPFRARLLATRCARWDGYLEFQRRPEPMLEWFATPAAFEDKRCSACPCPASNGVSRTMEDAFGGRLGGASASSITWHSPPATQSRRVHLPTSASATTHAILDVRFWGAVAVIKQAPSRIRPGGSIGLTTGTVGQRPVPGAALAAAGAGAADGLVRGL